jgi:uncharacterized RDD family membrane protein YckC
MEDIVMNETIMNEIEDYVNAVLRSLTVSTAERQRIETDLRAHLSQALEDGSSIQDVFARMGDPEEVAAAFMAQTNLIYAGFWLRLGAFAIDLVLLVFTALIFGGIAFAANTFVPPHPESLADYLYGALVLMVLIGSALVAVSTFLLYFPLLEGRFGQTLGKRLLGLRVLKEGGLPIGFREAFLRRLSYYFDFLPVDALFIFFNAKRQRAFDIIARTIVVQEL